MTNHTPQQLAVIDHITTSSRSLVVEAVAGSGKTTTIVSAVERMAAEGKGNMAIVAFNKSIADEVGAKVSSRGIDWKTCQVKTVHSFGFGALKRMLNLGKNAVNGNKVSNLLDALIREKDHDDPRDAAILKSCKSELLKLVSLAKQSLIGVDCEINDIHRWQDIADHHDVLSDLPPEVTERQVIVWAARLLRTSNDQRDVVDYDDMIYLALLLRCHFWGQDVIFVDEAQDTNKARRALVRAMLKPRGKVIAVGDRCQPGDEMISVAVGPKRIRETKRLDEIEVGDYVSTYNFEYGHEITAREITGVTRRPYNAELVVVNTGALQSKYTLNHKCIVKYPNTVGQFCVYIMKRGRGFRCGMSQLDVGESGCGLATRMRAEDADSVWLLNAFDDRREAFSYEQVVSAIYRLPQLMFTSKESTSVQTQEHLDSIWKQIENEEDAVAALHAHGRLLSYPIFERGQINCSLKRPKTVHACNLFEGCYVQLKGDGYKEDRYQCPKWVPAVISREQFDGMVVSLAVDKEENYYANGILTHNCQAIYGFTGSDSDALDLIRDEFNAEELPLSVCFRCAAVIVRYAQQWVPHIQPFNDDGAGIVDTQPMDKIDWTTADRSSVILCRNNGPLVALAYSILKSGTPCYIEGRDIAKGLVDLCKKWKLTSLSQLENRLNKYHERETKKALEKKQEQLAASIDDRIQTLFVFIERCRSKDVHSIEGLVSEIQDIFGDTAAGEQPDCLTLSSIHKSKGREWPTVYWLDMEGTLPSPFARQEWQEAQENNLCYVAATRAENAIIHVIPVIEEQ